MKDKDKETNKSVLFITIISVLTLLVAIAGATFAWFSATVTGNEASSVIVETATLGIVYENGNEIKLINAVPGDKVENKTFTVSAADGSTIDQKYDINWDVANFDFANKDELLYSLSGTTEGTGTVCTPVTDSAMPANTGVSKICTGTLKPNETHTYSLSVKFNETNVNQNANQGKKFTGKISVTSQNVSAS